MEEGFGLVRKEEVRKGMADQQGGMCWAFVQGVPYVVSKEC